MNILDSVILTAPLIDFDLASRAWRQNKVQISPGVFKYVCGRMKSDGTKCHNPPHRKIVGRSCHLHLGSELPSII